MSVSGLVGMVLLWLSFLLFGAAHCSELTAIELFQHGFQVDKICSFVDPTNISENCVAQLSEACRNQTVLLTMLDASSKIPYTGMMAASRNDLGGYDECVAIDHTWSGGRILGKHCLYGMIIPDYLFDAMKNPYLLSPCLPDACTGEDYMQLFQSILGVRAVLFDTSRCSTKEPPPYEAGDIITIFIIGTCVLLLVAQTIYDIYLMKYQLKSPHPLFQAFSVLYNGRKLLQTTETPSKDQILMFQGLRVLFMLWIIAGHGYIGQNNFSFINDETVSKAADQFYTVYIQAAAISVESFFFITGFLIAYQYLANKRYSLLQRIKAVPLMIIQRYLRIMPAALMVWLVVVYLFQHLGSGPLYLTGYHGLKKPCVNYWWAYFLYIQNYYNYDNVCIIPTWYISADLQLFIFSPLLLIPAAVLLKKGHFKRVMAGLMGATLFLIVLPIFTKLNWKNYRNDFDTHSRASSFIIGIVMGTFLRERGNKPFFYDKFSERTANMINRLLWTACIIIMIVIMLMIETSILYFDYETAVIWSCISRPLWNVCLSWMLYSCYYGKGGFANWFLSRPIFQILARLTYSMYLTHGVVVAHYISKMRTREFFDDYFQFIRYCGYTVITIMLSTFWTLAFESPMITVSKVIFGKLGKPSKRSET